MRTLLFMPGGLELHIGVSSKHYTWLAPLHFAPACLQGESFALDSSDFHDMQQAVNHRLTHLKKPMPCIYRCSSQH